jgi:hypothetical protein
VEANRAKLTAGYGVAIVDEGSIAVRAGSDAEVLLFDIA